jgi:hypothetical protein
MGFSLVLSLSLNSRKSYGLGGENRSNEDGPNLETMRPTHVDTIPSLSLSQFLLISMPRHHFALSCFVVINMEAPKNIKLAIVRYRENLRPLFP